VRDYDSVDEYLYAFRGTQRWVGAVIAVLVVLACIILAGSITGTGT
jgi:hypothetical protein